MSTEIPESVLIEALAFMFKENKKLKRQLAEKNKKMARMKYERDYDFIFWR